jgi:hypothetical protein
MQKSVVQFKANRLFATRPVCASTRAKAIIGTMTGGYTSEHIGMDPMTGVFDRQKAIFDFRKFVSLHRAWQGRHVDLAAARGPSVEHAGISKGDALEVFFQLHPEHVDSQSAIEADFGGEEWFTFSKERWGETTKMLSAPKSK